MKQLIVLAMASISIAQPALSLNKKDILNLVGASIVITRAAKLCPQYEFSTADVFGPTIDKAKEAVGEKAVNKEIDNMNAAIKDLLVYGLKDKFCDLAKNRDAEMESILK